MFYLRTYSVILSNIIIDYLLYIFIYLFTKLTPVNRKLRDLTFWLIARLDFYVFIFITNE